ncbi:MAG: division/cell wall cluster transcriptional repressor MraZ [Oscillospiraceae bacterium]|nr:division/cell wall cluster transcriptional repressor MraZ [Oscillospiraceae bacterium]
MTGEYAHSIDAKGRLFFPAKLRDELGTVFHVTLSFTEDECLSAYSADVWEQIMAKLNSLPYSKQNLMRPIFANATKCEMDAQGRILLPQKLRHFAGLTKDVAIVGAGNHVEIWDAEKWAAKDATEATLENIAAVMRELEF